MPCYKLIWTSLNHKVSNSTFKMLPIWMALLLANSRGSGDSPLSTGRERSQKVYMNDLTSKLTMHSILIQNISLHCVTFVWILDELSDLNKQTHVNCAKQMCTEFYYKGLDNIYNKLAIHDESWIFLNRRSWKFSNRCLLQEDQDCLQMDKSNVTDKKLLFTIFNPNKCFASETTASRETVNASA